MTPDADATFTRLFDEHRQAIHAFLLGRASDPSTAGDLLQETFLRLWRRLDDVRDLPTDRQRAWLVTVARNLTIDHYRAAATDRDRLERARHDPQPVEPSPADRAAWAEQVAALDDLITALPEEQRVILAMATVGEMDSRSIAASLDLPPGTVRYRLHQARKTLASKLDLEA